MRCHPRKTIRPYHAAAGGWGALRATAEALTEQGIAVSGSATLLRINQPAGFDCPGCAWPDPKHTSSFEFCENGAKAVAWEATAKRCGPEFFAAHTVSELEGWSDYDLEMQGRLTHPMVYDSATDRYRPIDWDEAFALIGRHLNGACRPERGRVLHLGANLQRSRIPVPAVRPRVRHQQFPRLLEHVPRGDERRPAGIDRRRARARACWKISTRPTSSSSSARTRAPTARA